MIDWIAVFLGLFIIMVAARSENVPGTSKFLLGYFGLILTIRGLEFILPNTREGTATLACFSMFTWGFASIRTHLQWKGPISTVATIGEISVFVYVILGSFM